MGLPNKVRVRVTVGGASLEVVGTNSDETAYLVQSSKSTLPRSATDLEMEAILGHKPGKVGTTASIYGAAIGK